VRKMRLYANRFFPFLVQRKFTAADKVLENIKKEIRTTDWQRGYINSLEGMLLALRSKDRHVLIKTITSESIGKFNKEFYRQSRNKLLTDFDRGFFTAWNDYLQVLKGLSARHSVKRKKMVVEFAGDISTIW